MPGRRSFPARLAAQVGQIRAAFEADGVSVRNHPVGAPDAYTNFLFRAGRVLTRTGPDAELVRARFGDGNISGTEEPVPGLTAFTLTGPGADDRIVDSLLAELNNESQRVVATFDHILHVTGACCPATEPELVDGRRNLLPAPVPAVNPDSGAGDGIKVAVIDSGILDSVVNASADGQGPNKPPAHPWLALPPVTGDEETRPVGIYTGHGTFVAGVLRCVAPAANVRVYSVVGSHGAVSETDLAPRVLRALEEFDPDVVSMSAGTRTTGDNVLLSFEMLRQKLDQCNAVLVCAAGNDGDFGPFVPASLDWPEAVAVGALEEDEKTLAPYSNHGPAGHDWVDVYARGTDVVNAYPNGPYHYSQPPRSNGTPVTVMFANGMAKWSGTSFSTPFVAGLIAVRMKAKTQSAADAAKDLKRIAAAKVRAPGDLPTLTIDDALKP